MAQPKALKSPYGQKAQDLAPKPSGGFFADDLSDFVSPSGPLPDEDIIPPGTAIPGTARGLPEQQPQQQPQDQGIAAQQGGFVGPYAPEFYQGLSAVQPRSAATIPPAYREMYGIQDELAPQETGLDLPPEERAKRLESLIDRGELGTSVALGVAFPGMGLLGIASTAGALNYVKDSLKNQLVRAEKKEEIDKIFSSTITGALAGTLAAAIPPVVKGIGKGVGYVGEKALETAPGRAVGQAVLNNKAVRWFLDKLIQDGTRSGDETIVKHAKTMYDNLAEGEGLSYEKMLLQKAEEAEAAKRAGVELTAGEQFYFDDEARAATNEALASNPQIGRSFATRLGKYTRAIRGLFGPDEAAPAGGIKEYIVNQIDDYSANIGKINQELMRSGQDFPEVRLAGQDLLNTVDDTLKTWSTNLENDVLKGKVTQLWNLRNRLENQLKLGKAQEFIGGKAGAIVDEFGKPIPSAAPPLGLSDVKTFLDDVSKLARVGFEAEKKGIPAASLKDASHAAAMDLYGKLAQIRDSMSESIANKMGRPELAKRVSELRSTFSKRIDSWRAIEKDLAQAPADEIKYLFTKGNAKEAEQIVSVLPENIRSDVQRKFIGRLIDPVYLAETGEAAAVKALEASNSGKAAFATAKQQWESYDPGVKAAIYNPDQVKQIDMFLNLGQRAEKFLASRSASAKQASDKIVQSMGRLMTSPSASGVLGTMQEMISLLPSKSPLKSKLGAIEYVASKRAAGEVSAEAARKLGAPEAALPEVIGATKRALQSKLGKAIPQEVATGAKTGAAVAAGQTFSDILGR